LGRISYICVVYVIGATMPIHSSTPMAAPRPAVFALRHEHNCASTCAINKSSKFEAPWVRL
jgi:hypothetical protein